MSPGGLRGLQIRRGALEVSSVGSTPIRSRQITSDVAKLKITHILKLLAFVKVCPAIFDPFCG